jgi:DNA repair ATPase RecN
MFGGADRAAEQPSPLYGLAEEERERIGTEEDPLRNFETAMQRNEKAERALQDGDTERAVDLLEQSVSEGFVGSHPYERLASIYESRRNPAEALRVSEAFTRLATSGKMPRGAQRSADRKLPEFEARIERYKSSLDTDQ